MSKMDDPCCAYLRLIQPVLDYLQRSNAPAAAESPGDTTFTAEMVAAAAMAVAVLHFALSSARHYASRRQRHEDLEKKSS